MKKILIIDGSSLFFRAFYALPPLKNSKGFPTNAIYGFVSMLENAVETVKPTHLAVCFDLKGKTFRHVEYEDYKANRQKMPDELGAQFPVVRKILDLMNIKVLESSKYEADDLAGSLAKIAEGEGFQSVLLTGDKDYFQLISENTLVLMTRKGITEMDIYDLEKLDEVYGLTPMEFIDLKGLMGDPSDNIPGVKGVGEKTGLKLLKEFGSIENIYQNLEQVSGKALKEKLSNDKAQAFMSKRLATIIRDVKIDEDIDDFKVQPYKLDELVELYRDYEFNTLLRRLPIEKKAVEKKEMQMSDDSFVDYLSKIKGKNVAIKFFTEGKVYEGIKPTYLALMVEGEDPAFYDFDETLLDKLKKVIESKDISLSGHNIKEDLIILMHYGIDGAKIEYDSEIAQYLLTPEDSGYAIEKLTLTHLGEKMETLEDILGKGKKYVPLKDKREEVKHYAGEYLINFFEIKKVQENLMDEESKKLFREIEIPLVEVLASMELEGFKVEKQVLKDIGSELTEKLKTLEEEIYEEAGQEFNLNSPKQLGEILFEKLNFPVIKKTKTGYSTAADVLEKLKGEGPIIGNILEYRKLSKLMSTYVDGIMDIIVDGKIHSSFNQTTAVTGRISSTEPNLQNIPIRTPEGRLIRKAFVPTEGSQLIDADYSQIELRILAHVSGDEHMQLAFKNKEDIHTSTAAKIFHVKPEDVTGDLRAKAKAVNFGIVYGISDYGLSQNLNIPRQEAKEYIDNYLNNYKGIKKFMHDIVELGKKQGYVRTIFGRKRNIPELSNRNFNIRSFGERIALNTPIQGSAADIIKIAMVKVYNKLKSEHMDTKLILQVHDELILNSPKNEVEKAKKILTETMEGAADLDVDLVVDVEVLDNWYDAK